MCKGPVVLVSAELNKQAQDRIDGRATSSAPTAHDARCCGAGSLVNPDTGATLSLFPPTRVYS